MSEQLNSELYSDVLLTLLLESHTWVKRRVEQIEMLDDENIRLNVSIDCDLRLSGRGSQYVSLAQKSKLPLLVVPLGLLARQPLQGFSLRGSDGKALSLLTENETTPLMQAVLRRQAASVVGELAELVSDDIDQLVTCDAADARAAYNRLRVRFRARAGKEPKARLFADPLFTYLAQSATSRFLALAVVPPEAADRRLLIKYTYVTTLPWPEFRWTPRRMAGGPRERIGLRSAQFAIEQPLVRLSASYHVEVAAPEGLQIRRLRLDRQSARGTPQDVLRPPIRGRLPRAHGHIAGRPFSDQGTYTLLLRLAPLRRGLVRNATVGTLLALLAISTVWLAHERIATRPITNVASLLLVVPGLVATYVARPTEHALTSRLCFGIRAAVFVGAALPCFVAAALVALQVSSSNLFRSTTVLLILVIVTLGVLLLAYRRAGQTT